MDCGDLISHFREGALDRDVLLPDRDHFAGTHMESGILFIGPGHLQKLWFLDAADDVPDIRPVDPARAHGAGFDEAPLLLTIHLFFDQKNQIFHCHIDNKDDQADKSSTFQLHLSFKLRDHQRDWFIVYIRKKRHC